METASLYITSALKDKDKDSRGLNLTIQRSQHVQEEKQANEQPTGTVGLQLDFECFIM